MTTVAVTEQPRECGGTQAFGELLDFMRPELLAYCRRRVGVDRAEEIHSDVQLAALRAHQAGKQLSPGWLMTVARNKVIDHWRRVEREDKLIEKMKGECPVFVTDERHEELNDVAVTLGQLQPRYSSILVRHYLHGESVGDMATDDGVTYSAMESAMARARSAFRSSHDAA